jgi:hypothetical protein
MPKSKPPRRKKPLNDPMRTPLQALVERGNVIAEMARTHGKLIAPDDPEQHAMAEESFKTGASWMFQLMTRMNDDTGDDDEITDADLRRMERLAEEAMKIDAAMAAKYGKRQ